MNRFFQDTLAALAVDPLMEAGVELEGGSNGDDGSSRSKRLRVVSIFVYALR